MLSIKIFDMLWQINSYMINYKTGPLGQTHSNASSEDCFLLFCFSIFEKWGRTDNMCKKTMIPTGSDFVLAEWINMVLELNCEQESNTT